MLALQNHECLDSVEISLQQTGGLILQEWGNHKRCGYENLGYGGNVLDLSSGSAEQEYRFTDDQVAEINEALISFGETDDKIAFKAVGLMYISRLPIRVVATKLHCSNTRVKDAVKSVKLFMAGKFGHLV